MDAVILAAGKGQRMLGYTVPFFKPLLEVNGITLLAYAVEYAAAAGAEKTVVVVSPRNVEPVERVLAGYSSWVKLVTQDEPRGPGHATLVGIRGLGVSSRAMLLMSDNIMDQTRVIEMSVTAEVDQANAVGVRTVPAAQATRFTRIRRGATDGRYTFVEGTELEADDLDPATGKATVWCGPVILDTPRALAILEREWSARERDERELKIGPYLTEILRAPTRLHDVGAMDVGVPAAFEAAMAGAAR